MPSEWQVVSVHLIPRQASQRLSMARYATSTATEIQTQWDSNPVLTTEQHFKSNKMKDAWKGLKLLTGQKEGKKASSLTSTPGSADRLNLFYSRFDNKDYSSIHQTQKSDLEKRKIHEALITITEEDVYKVLKEINTNKATGPDKISGRIVKQCTTSLLSI